jgi:hypothetical protein
VKQVALPAGTARGGNGPWGELPVGELFTGTCSWAPVRGHLFVGTGGDAAADPSRIAPSITRKPLFHKDSPLTSRAETRIVAPDSIQTVGDGGQQGRHRNG